VDSQAFLIRIIFCDYAILTPKGYSMPKLFFQLDILFMSPISLQLSIHRWQSCDALPI